MIKLSLPWPPSANHCYVTTKWGQRVLTREAKAYQDQATALVYVQATGAEPLPALGDLVLEFRYFAPDRRKRDLDNTKKVLVDAIRDGLGCDDSRFLCRDMSRVVDRDHPRVEVGVYPDAETV